MSKLHHFPGPWLLMSNKKVSQLPHRLEHLSPFSGCRIIPVRSASGLCRLYLSNNCFFSWEVNLGGPSLCCMAMAMAIAGPTNAEHISAINRVTLRGLVHVMGVVGCCSAPSWPCLLPACQPPTTANEDPTTSRVTPSACIK